MNSRRWLVVTATIVVLSGTLLLRTRGEQGDASPLRAPKIPASVIHRPTPLADRIVLTRKGDPATTQAVTWRTDPTIATAYAELGPCDDSAAFAGIGRNKPKSKTQRFPAETTTFKSDLSTANYHSVSFENLTPNTAYLYRVGDGTNWSEWLEFRTASTDPEPFAFLYFGDAQNDIKAHWSRVIRRAYHDAPDARFLLHAGDLINSANSDADWGEWFSAGGWINGVLPSVPTPGNHEWFNTKARTRPRLFEVVGEVVEKDPPYQGAVSRHWRQQFALPENGPKGQEELTYWFDYQGVRFVSLNSNESLAKSHADKIAQAEWLDRVLTDNPNRWTIVTFHHPMYSPAKSRDNAGLRQYWQPLFDKHGVDLVLTGHDHTYARSGQMLGENVPSGGSVRPNGGTVYCVSVSGPKMYELNKQEWMVSSVEGTQLYQIVRLDGDRLHYEARTASGALHDVFELRKRSDGTNQLVERAQLEMESSDWWASGGLVVSGSLAVIGLLIAMLLLRRRGAPGG